MASKTNYKKGKNKYFRISRTVGYNESGKPIRKEFYGKSKKEATAKADEFMEKINKGLNIDLANQTLYYACEIWLFEVKKMDSNIKPSTFSRYETAVRNMLLESDNIAKMKVSEVTSLDIQKFINIKVNDLNKTFNQIQNFLKVLKMFFKYAEEEGYTLKNPTKNLNNPGKKFHKYIDEDDDDDNMNYETYSEEEISLIKTEMDRSNYRLRLLILLGIATGLRKGELLGLKYTDISEGFITVRRTLSAPSLVGDDKKLYTEICIWEPKSEASKRIIPFPKSLYYELEQHKKRQIEERHAKNIMDEPIFIFESEECNNLDPRNLYRSYIRLLKRAGVKYKRFHTLRHTFATRHIRIGTPLTTLKELMGHSDISMTMKYVHINKDDMSKAMNTYESTF